jgi:hypothetical protein
MQGPFTQPLTVFFCSGDSVKGTVGPELAFFYRYKDGYDRHVVGKNRLRFGGFFEVDSNRSARTRNRATAMVSVHMLSLMGRNSFYGFFTDV